MRALPIALVVLGLSSLSPQGLAEPTPPWLAASTDMVFPGQDQSEMDHSLALSSGNAGPVLGYHVRDAVDGGYFSYQMKVLPETAMTLVVFYWGSDGDRDFKVLANDQLLAEESLTREAPNRFFERRYPITAEQIGNRNVVTVKFLANAGSIAGGAFGLLMLPSESATAIPHIGFESFYAKSPFALEETKRGLELDSETLDLVHIGDRASEEEHQLQGENTYSGKSRHRIWRDARDGGYFSYNLKVDPERPVSLVATYDGGDRDRDFVISIDGKYLTTQLLDSNLPGEFQDVVYDIPAADTRGKTSVTVKFEAPLPGFAGGIFGLRSIYSEKASQLFPQKP